LLFRRPQLVHLFFDLQKTITFRYKRHRLAEQKIRGRKICIYTIGKLDGFVLDFLEGLCMIDRTIFWYSWSLCHLAGVFGDCWLIISSIYYVLKYNIVYNWRYYWSKNPTNWYGVSFKKNELVWEFSFPSFWWKLLV
jgi:hypothetical protein